MRRTVAVVLLAGLVALSVYPFLGSGEPAEPGAPDFPPYTFGNPLVLSQPPHSAYSEAIFADPIARTVHRLEWGKTELVHWNQGHLPEPREELMRRICERVQQLGPGAPLAARRLLETLGILGDAAAIPTLLQFAQKDPDYLQLTAIQALTHCPLTPEAEDVLVRLSGHANEQVRGAATRAVLGRSEQWDQEAIVAFLEGRDNEQVNLLLSEVGKFQDAGFALDAIARHLDSESLRTRQLAIGALLAQRDPRGFAAAEAELDLPDSSRQMAALTLYRDARTLPPLERARELADQPGDVPLVLAQALRPGPDEPAEANEPCLRILERIADRPDELTRRQAIEAMFRRGHYSHLSRYRQDLDRAYGAALKDAVKFLCEQLRDPAALEPVRRRLATTTEPLDRVNLLFGLRFLGDAEDADRFLDWMVVGGTSADRVASEQTYTSEFAALYLQDLPGVVAPRLMQRFPEATTVWGKLCMLDALRAVASGADELAFVCALIEDVAQPMEVRLAAAESLPFLGGPELGDRVLALAEAATSQELGQRLLQIYACYF